MRQRLVIPEILDSLPHSDPEAKRARRDLRLVNFFMGNYRWLRRRMKSSALTSWVELGSGEGCMADQLRGEVNALSVTGVDYVPRPAGWPEPWEWLQGDLFESLVDSKEEISTEDEGCAASLFIHHFESPELSELGALLQKRFVRIVLSEPARFRFFRVLAHLFVPFVNRVTWHDMQISIGAGFRKGELAPALGLGQDWTVCESVGLFGAHRFEAWKEVR